MSNPTPNQSAVHLPPELLQRLQQRAVEEHCTVDELAADVVAAFLDDVEWEKGVEQARGSMAAGRGRPFEDVAEELRERARKIARG